MMTLKEMEIIKNFEEFIENLKNEVYMKKLVLLAVCFLIACQTNISKQNINDAGKKTNRSQSLFEKNLCR